MLVLNVKTGDMASKEVNDLIKDEIVGYKLILTISFKTPLEYLELYDKLYQFNELTYTPPEYGIWFPCALDIPDYVRMLPSLAP